MPKKPPPMFASTPPWNVEVAEVEEAVKYGAVGEEEADIVPALQKPQPLAEERFAPVPPYCEPIVVPFQTPVPIVPREVIEPVIVGVYVSAPALGTIVIPKVRPLEAAVDVENAMAVWVVDA